MTHGVRLQLRKRLIDAIGSRHVARLRDMISHLNVSHHSERITISSSRPYQALDDWLAQNK